MSPLAILILAGLSASAASATAQTKPFQPSVHGFQLQNWLDQIHLADLSYQIGQMYRPPLVVQAPEVGQLSSGRSPTTLSRLRLHRGPLFLDLTAMTRQGEQHLRETATHGSPLDEVGSSARQIRPIMGMEW